MEAKLNYRSVDIHNIFTGIFGYILEEGNQKKVQEAVTQSVFAQTNDIAGTKQ